MFTHLRVRSGFAPLMGATRISDLVAWAKQAGTTVLAVTDPGTMHGAYALQKAAAAEGIKVAHGVALGGELFFAVDKVGIGQLIQLVSHEQAGTPVPASLDGVLIVTGGPGSRIRGLKEGERPEYPEFFDTAFHVLIELQVGDEDAWPDLVAIAEEIGTEVIPTADVAYATPGQRLDLLLLEALRTKRKLDAVEEAAGTHLLSAFEMTKRTAAHPEAMANLAQLLEQIDWPQLEAEDGLWPTYDKLGDNSLDDFFYDQIKTGIHRRYPDGASAEIKARLREEYDIITGKGYASYFLVLADLLTWCREQGIGVGPGRGSAAGSLVSFVLGITDTDPLRHELLFERFLNPERESPPDIDMDFSQARRQEVVDHLSERWGSDRVCQVGTLGTIKAKSALKDANRALGMSFGLGERLSNAVPAAIVGRDCPLHACFDESHERYKDAQEMRDLVDQDPEAATVVQHALRIEGLVRQTGVHPAGVIVSTKPMHEHAPMMRRDGTYLTQWDYPTCEAHGFLKIDVLGLRNLDVLQEAIRQVEKSTGIAIDYLKIPTEDSATFAMMSAGDTLGVFQLDSDPMRGLLRGIRPDCFDDVRAVLALYRPGPMAAGFHTAYAERKNGAAVAPIHPALQEALEPILGPTYNLLVYQDQTLQIARAVAGYSLGGADELRRAMGKKKREVMAAEYDKFSTGMHDAGYPAEAIKVLWDVIEANADYQFVKSHATSYGQISWWTGYLKANYPREFMTALLTYADDKDRAALYLTECRRMGIRVSAPDVRYSEVGYSLGGDGTILIGLAAIDGVSADVAEAIVGQRWDDASSLLDWLVRQAPATVDKRVLEALIRAGALGHLGTRAALLAVVPDVLKLAKTLRKASLAVDVPFELLAGPELPAVEEFPALELLAMEKSLLGLYVSSHPLYVMADRVADLASNSIGALGQLEDRARVRVAGLVTQLYAKTTKNGSKPWAIVTLEDLDGSVDVLLFPSSWAQMDRGSIRVGSVIVVEGRVSHRDGRTAVLPDSVSCLDLGNARPRPITVRVPAPTVTEELLAALEQILRTYPGTVQVSLALSETERWSLVELAGGLADTADAELALTKLFGPGAISRG